MNRYKRYRIPPAKICKNLYKHIWLDDGLKDNTEKFIYTCRKCGKKRYKVDSFSMNYYDEHGTLIGDKAPECVPTRKPY